jgi:hypothetical protein
MRMSRFPKTPALLGLLLGFLVLIIFWTWLFGLLTFFTSILVFGRIECDRNIHEISFYARGDLPSSFRRWSHYYSIAEVLGRSTLLGLLPIFLFSGTDTTRIILLASLFAACVILGYSFLNFIQTRTQIDVTRWVYVRLSVVLGLLFSVLSSHISGQSLTEIATQTAKSKWWGQLDFNEVAELLYGMIYQVNDFIASTLIKLFGSIIGNILGLIVSVNIIYGFLVALYSLLLLRFISTYTLSGIPPAEPAS